MSESEVLAKRFEENRDHLRAVAYRMLGSASEADDAIQETWLRLNRSDASDIENLRAWLTTVTARVCLDMLRARTARREDVLETETPISSPTTTTMINPEQEAILANSVGIALLMVMDQLNPAERLALVLHDMFDVSFDEIAQITGRTPTAARQLASRARRRVQGKKRQDVHVPTQRKVVDAFLAALRKGDFEGLVAVLDPDVVVRLDEAAVRPGTPREIRGARNWAQGAVAFSQAARFAQPALIDGKVGLVVAFGGGVFRVLQFIIAGGKIMDVDIVADPARLQALSVSVIEN